MNKILNSLTVLRGLADNKVISSLTEYAITEYRNDEKLNDFLFEIYNADAEENLLKYVQTAILYDINAFSTACAAGKSPSDHLSSAFERDVNTILQCVDGLPVNHGFDIGNPISHFEISSDKQYAPYLCKFYGRYGYGQFIHGKAYKYADGALLPLDCTDSVKLTDLKNYEDQKRAVKNNILDFLNGLPFANMLLYGDRGTGKSSTIHAILNEYSAKGLRLIEVDRDDLESITQIKQEIATLPLKFIIFIDDLTLEDDKNASALRAAVEGSIVDGTNAMVVATSNRRHIIKESSSDRDNSVFLSDTIEEQLSLSDRFGLTVMFSTTDKENYLSIVCQLAKDYSLTTPTDEIFHLAERWAIIKGGRSPRKAKQFVQFAYSCEKSNRPIEF